jgi:hypothetical protein
LGFDEVEAVKSVSPFCFIRFASSIARLTPTASVVLVGT